MLCILGSSSVTAVVKNLQGHSLEDRKMLCASLYETSHDLNSSSRNMNDLCYSQYRML